MEKVSLETWIINFVKYKDVFHKKLIKFESVDDKIVFYFKDGIKIYIVSPILSPDILEIKSEEIKIIVCDAVKENLDFIILNWKELVKFKDTSLMFVNIVENTKMIINPEVHARICDDENLVDGLYSMFNSAFRTQDS